VRDLSVRKTVCKLLPCLRSYLVGLTDVQAPYLARWSLEDVEKTKDLLVSHPFIEVLA
jgi:hypothetical protein